MTIANVLCIVGLAAFAAAAMAHDYRHRRGLAWWLARRGGRS